MRTFFLVILLHFFNVSVNAINNTPFQSLDHAVDSLQNTLRHTKDDSVKVYSLIRLSDLYGLTDYKKAVDYAEQAVSTAKASGIKRLWALSLIYCGTVYYNMGILDAATDRFTQYDELARESGNKEKMALSKINLGAVYLSLENYDKAKVLHLEALKLLKAHATENKLPSVSPRLINIYNNLSGIYREEGNLKKAMEYSDQGLNMARKIPGSYRILDMLLDNKAKLLILEGKYGDAMETYHEILEMNLRENDLPGLASTYTYLGELYEKQNLTVKAFQIYKEAYKIAEQAKKVGTLNHIAKSLFRLYSKFGPADSALKYDEISKSLDLKINKENADKLLITNELTALYKERENTRMKEYQRKLILPWGITSVVLILAMLLVFIFFHLRKKQRRIQLEKMNNDLTNQKLLLEKELLQNELESKDKELATQVLYKIRKNEMIEGVVRRLLENRNKFDKENQEIIGDVIEVLGKTKEELVWTEFEIRFQQVHQGFYENLHKQFPDLTPNERRLCAFLKLNTSSKEISAITGQSLHSIQVARTRLRKKLSLTNTDKGLIEFLESL